MFTNPIFGNFFQPFTAGFSPLTVGTGFSGMTPFLMQQPHQIGAFGGFSPLPPQFVGYGGTPYNVAPGAGILPVPTSPFGAIPTPVINPLALSQIPTVNPTILPNLVPQLTVGTGFSGMTPFLMQQPQLTGAFGGFSPLPPQFGGYGVTPYNVAPGAGILPVPTSHFGAIPTPVINPLALSQLPAVNPTILPNLVPQMWGGPLNQGWINPTFQGWINPASQLLGGEANYLGLSPFSSQFGWSTVSPYVAQEPIVNTLLAQQLNPLAQQRMPIRSLVNPQQIDPYQAGVAGVPGSVINQAIDPYSLLAQAQFMPQLGANPIQQIGRAFTSANWFVPPYSMGQTFPMAQVGAPFGI